MQNPQDWTREQIERHSVDMRQFIDFRDSTLPNGLRIVEAYNASGLSFTVLPDRGLDIWTAHYKGLPLTWVSQGSPHFPDFGQSWSQQFNGGLLTTCGLRHVGSPETDTETGEVRDLHGRYSRLRAQDVHKGGGWETSQIGERYTLHLGGVVAEQRLFGEQLRLTRRYDMTLGEPSFSITDVVVNLADQPVPLMVLYHFNVGFPLVSAGARLDVPAAHSYPRDDAAHPGFDRWPEYDAATPGYAEQVFYHHVKSDESGWSRTALLHDNFGLEVAWDARAMPYLNQWKNTRQGIYVNGIEPANCVPEGLNWARQQGIVQILQPGESQTFAARLTVLDGVDAVQREKAELEGLRQNGTPVNGFNLPK
jgi:hypothetical protein